MYYTGSVSDLLVDSESSMEITEEEIAENSYQVKVPIFKQFQMLDRYGTDTKIDLPESGHGSAMMTITGRKENVMKTVIQVQQIQNEMANEFPEDGSGSDLELDNIVEDSMTVDPKHHRHFVARREEVLKRIGDEFGGVVVSFPRNEVAGDKDNLKGARNCIDAAITRISEIVEDLEDMVTIDCKIEQNLHRFE